MTNQEIKHAILKEIDKDKVVAHIDIYWLSKDSGEDEKRIRSLQRQLIKEGLLRARIKVE